MSATPSSANVTETTPPLETTGLLRSGDTECRLSTLPLELLTVIWKSLGIESGDGFRSLLERGRCPPNDVGGTWTIPQQCLALSSKYYYDTFKETPVILSVTFPNICRVMDVQDQSQLIKYLEDNPETAMKTFEIKKYKPVSTWVFTDYRPDAATRRLLKTLLKCSDESWGSTSKLRTALHFPRTQIIRGDGAPHIDWDTLTGNRVHHHIMPRKNDGASLTDLPTTPSLSVYLYPYEGSEAIDPLTGARTVNVTQATVVPRFLRGTTLPADSKIYCYLSNPPLDARPAVLADYFHHFKVFGQGLETGRSAPNGEFTIYLSAAAKNDRAFFDELKKQKQTMTGRFRTKGSKFKIVFDDGTEL